MEAEECSFLLGKMADGTQQVYRGYICDCKQNFRVILIAYPNYTSERLKNVVLGMQIVQIISFTGFSEGGMLCSLTYVSFCRVVHTADKIYTLYHVKRECGSSEGCAPTLVRQAWAITWW